MLREGHLVRRAGAFRIERYGRRFWAGHEDSKLLCVAVYKKGALAVVHRTPALKPRILWRRHPWHSQSSVESEPGPSRAPSTHNGTA